MEDLKRFFDPGYLQQNELMSKEQQQQCRPASYSATDMDPTLLNLWFLSTTTTTLKSFALRHRNVTKYEILNRNAIFCTRATDGLDNA